MMSPVNLILNKQIASSIKRSCYFIFMEVFLPIHVNMLLTCDISYGTICLDNTRCTEDEKLFKPFTPFLIHLQESIQNS